MTHPVRACVAAVALLTTLTLSPRAWSQESTEVEDRRTAASLANVARERYDEGDYAAALPMFIEAEARAQSPVISLYIARCQVKLGRLLEAREKLRAVLAESLEEGAPEQFVKAREDAAEDLSKLVSRVPQLIIEVGPRLPPGGHVELDAVVVPAEQLGLSQDVDPGRHRLRMIANGQPIASTEVEVGEGTVERVRLGFEVPLPAPSPAPEEPPSDGLLVAGIVFAAAGGAALAGGAVTGIYALAEVDDVKSGCSGNECPVADQERVADAESVGTVSTVLFIAGGVVAAGGIALITIHAMGGDSETPASAGPGFTTVTAGTSGFHVVTLF